MKLFGNQFESPSVVPNRTVSAMKDIGAFIRRLDSVSGEREDIILSRTAAVFRESGFSEVLRPLTNQLDQEPLEIVQIYLFILIQTLLRNKEANATVLLSTAVLIVRCFEEVNGSKPTIPLPVSDMEMLSELAYIFSSSSSMNLTLLKEIVGLVQPSVRTIPLYVDLGGFFGLRDNLKDANVKNLSRGSETGRTVRVDNVGDNDVGIFHNDEVIFQLGAQTKHNSEFRTACGSILQELSDIIPPPIYSEPEIELLDVLPSRQVKSLLKSGRLTPQARMKRAASLPPPT